MLLLTPIDVTTNPKVGISCNTCRFNKFYKNDNSKIIANNFDIFCT